MAVDGDQGASAREGAEAPAGGDEGDGDPAPGGAARASTAAAAPTSKRSRRRSITAPREMSFDASEARARRIVARVARDFDGAPAEVQERVAQMIALLDDLRIPQQRGLLLDQADLALRHLARPRPSLVIFDRVIEHLRGRVGGRGLRFARLIVSASPHIVVACGVAVSMVICFIILVWGLRVVPRADLESLQQVTEAGFAGALTSVMLRFNRWRGQRHFTSRDAFFEGLFRPFIGVFFAWMFYYFLEAGFLPFQPAPGVDKIYLFAAVAFAAGFSERLAVSFVEGLEGRRRP